MDRSIYGIKVDHHVYNYEYMNYTTYHTICMQSKLFCFICAGHKRQSSYALRHLPDPISNWIRGSSYRCVAMQIWYWSDTQRSDHSNENQSTGYARCSWNSGKTFYRNNVKILELLLLNRTIISGDLCNY